MHPNYKLSSLAGVFGSTEQYFKSPPWISNTEIDPVLITTQDNQPHINPTPAQNSGANGNFMAAAPAETQATAMATLPGAPLSSVMRVTADQLNSHMFLLTHNSRYFSMYEELLEAKSEIKVQNKLMTQVGQSSVRRAPSHTFATPQPSKPLPTVDPKHVLPSTTPPTPLDPQDYPANIMWTESSYSDDSNRRKNLSQKITTYDYLRKEDGSVVADEREIREMRHFFFSLCHRLVDANMLPRPGWTKARPEPAKYVYDSLATKYSVFRYANSTWKLKQFCIRSFPDFNRNTDDALERGPKRKAKARAEDDQRPKKKRVKVGVEESGSSALLPNSGSANAGFAGGLVSTAAVSAPIPPLDSILSSEPPPPVAPLSAPVVSPPPPAPVVLPPPPPPVVSPPPPPPPPPRVVSPPASGPIVSPLAPPAPISGSPSTNVVPDQEPSHSEDNVTTEIETESRSARASRSKTKKNPLTSVVIPKPTTEIPHSEIAPPTRSRGDDKIMVPNPVWRSARNMYAHHMKGLHPDITKGDFDQAFKKLTDAEIKHYTQMGKDTEKYPFPIITEASGASKPA